MDYKTKSLGQVPGLFVCRALSATTHPVIPGVVQHNVMRRRPGIAKIGAAFVMAGLDLAIFVLSGVKRIEFPPTCGEDWLSKVEAGWGYSPSSGRSN